MPFDFDSVRELLMCLQCEASLKQEEDRLVCENDQCGQVYPIRDDIPQLLAEDEDE